MPKALTVNLTASEYQQLQQMRLKYQSNAGEHAYYLLLLNEGFNVREIAQRLHRNKHTIRYWIKQYLAAGTHGLLSQLPPGRPAKKTRYIAEQLDELLTHSPQQYGYQQSSWQINLLIHYFQQQGYQVSSKKTIMRALKQQGWVYKRSAKAVPLHSPSAEEKLMTVQNLIETINTEKEQQPVEILFEDESHFTNEPYLERGWFKQGEKKP